MLPWVLEPLAAEQGGALEENCLLMPLLMTLHLLSGLRKLEQVVLGLQSAKLLAI